MKLKNYQILGLFQALTRLDDPDAGKKDKEKRSIGDSETVKFKFKASVLYALAKNHRKLKTAVEDIEKTRAALYKKYQDSPDQEQLKGDKATAFVQEYNDFLSEDGEVNLHTIKFADLDLDNNNIPIVIMSELIGTVIEEE